MVIGIYIIIFLIKLIENLLTAYRVIVYTDGHKHLSALLTAITALFWLYATSLVLLDFTNDPLKLFVYAFGQAIGIYLGSWIEGKVAIGNSLLYVVINEEKEKKIINNLRSSGFGVTTIKARGYEDKPRKLLMIMCKRKQQYKITNKIIKIDKSVVIMTKNPTSVSGSYVLE